MGEPSEVGPKAVSPKKTKKVDTVAVVGPEAKQVAVGPDRRRGSFNATARRILSAAKRIPENAMTVTRRMISSVKRNAMTSARSLMSSVIPDVIKASRRMMSSAKRKVSRLMGSKKHNAPVDKTYPEEMEKSLFQVGEKKGSVYKG